ncbi:MAG: hypothetical protein IPG64_00715 [Haliea sp.]|nr:hypothetical protein [Haliea sp.]
MPAAPDARSRDLFSTGSAFSREIPPTLQPLRLAPLALLLASGLAATAAQADHAQNPEGPTMETVEVHGERLRTDLLREQSLTPGGVTLIDRSHCSSAIYPTWPICCASRRACGPPARTAAAPSSCPREAPISMPPTLT